jgi:hypothetical protein
MRTHILLAAFLAIFSMAGAAEVRDGSSFERAILVQGGYEQSVDWEWAYLKKLFWGRGMPKEHGFMQHNGRWYDCFVFTTSSGDKVIYFDVTRFADRITRKHGTK